MTQKWESVDQNTEISSGLQKLMDRDLSALTRFSATDGRFPDEPFPDMWFDNSNVNVVFKYDGEVGKWTEMFEYTYGAPYTVTLMVDNFQPLSENLNKFSALSFSEKEAFIFPMGQTKLNLELLACGSDTEMKEYLSLGDMASRDFISGAFIDENTIPMEKFNLDLNKDVERVMSVGDIKRSFSKDFDQDVWCVADGRTLGSSVSVADLKGEKYKRLYLTLGGTQNDWSSGRTIQLPSFNNAFAQSGETKEIRINTTTTYTLRYEDGFLPYMTATCDRDGKVFVEVVGSGGASKTAVWKRKKHDRGAVGSGGGAGSVCAIIETKKNDVLFAKAGARSIEDEEKPSYFSINDVKLIEGKGGLNATGPYNDPWNEFIGGQGGGTYVNEEESCILSYVASSGKAGAPLAYVGWGSPRNYEARTVTGGSAGGGAKLVKTNGEYSLRTIQDDGSSGVCFRQSNGVSFNSLTDKRYYNGNGEFINFASDKDRNKICGAGSGWDNAGIASRTDGYHFNYYPKTTSGFVKFVDLTGCLESTTKHQAIKVLFLIHL